MATIAYIDNSDVQYLSILGVAFSSLCILFGMSHETRHIIKRLMKSLTGLYLALFGFAVCATFRNIFSMHAAVRLRVVTVILHVFYA